MEAKPPRESLLFPPKQATAAHRRCWHRVEVFHFSLCRRRGHACTHAYADSCAPDVLWQQRWLLHLRWCDFGKQSELLRQEIPLSSPGTPRRLMPAGATEPGLSPRIILSHGSRIESLTSVSSNNTHTHKTFFLRLPSQFSPWNHHKYFSWGGGVTGAKDWGQEEEEEAAPSQTHLILQGSSSFCPLKPVDSAQPGIYCSSAQLHYLWLLFLFLCAHSCYSDTKTSSLLRAVTIKKQDEYTTQHINTDCKLCIARPHLPSVLKWIFHKSKLSHPHRIKCWCLSAQSQRQETPPSCSRSRYLNCFRKPDMLSSVSLSGCVVFWARRPPQHGRVGFVWGAKWGHPDRMEGLICCFPEDNSFLEAMKCVVMRKKREKLSNLCITLSGPLLCLTVRNRSASSSTSVETPSLILWSASERKKSV